MWSLNSENGLGTTRDHTFPTLYEGESLFLQKSKKVRSINKKGRHALHRPMFSMVAGAEGIEPSLTVLETAVLPLNHAPNYSLAG